MLNMFKRRGVTPRKQGPVSTMGDSFTVGQPQFAPTKQPMIGPRPVPGGQPPQPMPNIAPKNIAPQNIAQPQQPGGPMLLDATAGRGPLAGASGRIPDDMPQGGIQEMKKYLAKLLAQRGVK